MSSSWDLLAVEATPNSATTPGNTAGECITLPATLMTPSLQTPPPLPGMLVHGLGPDGVTGPRGSDWTTSSPSSGLIAPTWIQATNNDKTNRVLNRFFLLENAIPFFVLGKKYFPCVYFQCFLARVLRRELICWIGWELSRGLWIYSNILSRVPPCLFYGCGLTATLKDFLIKFLNLTKPWFDDWNELELINNTAPSHTVVKVGNVWQ